MEIHERLILCEYLAKQCDAGKVWDNVRSFLVTAHDTDIALDLSELQLQLKL
jgi:hypothetical protein